MEDLPWLVDRDFNYFMSEDERQGSSSRTHLEMEDMENVIADC